MKKYLQPVAKKSVDDSTAAEVNVTGPVGAGNKRKLSKEDADVSNNNNNLKSKINILIYCVT